MDHFHDQGSSLHCEGIPLRELAVSFGTPLFVYSYATLARHYRAFDTALAGCDHLVCYAAKAGANLAILHAIGRLGGGSDVVSGGELFRSLRAGIPADRIVFSGVGKTLPEIEYALRRRIFAIHVESAGEFHQVAELAKEMSVVARIGFRFNPDVDAKTHPHIATGLRESKFGLPRDAILDLAKEACRNPALDPAGISLHIGSQIVSLDPFVEAASRAADLTRELRRKGVPVAYLDCGGGLGVPYRGETPPTPEDYARALLPIAKDLKVKLLLEPGRSLIGNAGVLLTRVIRVKRTPEKTFVIVDAAMNDLLRPALYGATHAIEAVSKRGRPFRRVDVVGPICESSDVLGKGIDLEEVEEGDLLCIRTAGAYGFSMSSQYNARPRAAEVLVHGEEVDVIRQRETFDDLIRGEIIPTWMAT